MLGPVILNIEGLKLLRAEEATLTHSYVGGVILFSRNYSNPTQLAQLIKQIREATPARRLLICLDQEGGRVQRFKNGFTTLPSLGSIGRYYEKDPEDALALAKDHAWVMSTELKAFDIDISFSPLLDLNNPKNPVIADRAFHQDPQIVIALVEAYIQGMKESGLPPIGKHFPGHGSTLIDTHYFTAYDKRERKVIKTTDLLPFTKLVSQLSGVMAAHVVYSQFDDKPATFSPYWLKKILREKLLFKGVIFSDDLCMQGAEPWGDITERANLALKSGCNAIIISDIQSLDFSSLEKVMETNESTTSNLECLINDDSSFPLNREELKNNPRWKAAHEKFSLLNKLRL